MSGEEDCSSRSFVNASGLHSHETVFYDIYGSYAVFGAHFVKLCKKSYRIQLFSVKGHRDTFFKGDFHIFCLVRSIFRLAAEHVYVFLILVPRVFQIAAFMADVPDVLVS